MGTASYDPTLYGTVTVGPKGQIVIPAEARKALKLEVGDKVVVMGAGPEGTMLGLCPASSIEKLLSHFTQRLEALRATLDQAESTKGGRS